METDAAPAGGKGGFKPLHQIRWLFVCLQRTPSLSTLLQIETET